MYKVFYLFLIYSFFGWLIEVFSSIAHLKKLVNRGLLIGPICPIYGVGSLLIISMLKPFLYSPIIVAFAAMFICASIEYLTSYFLEKIFKVRWWDYSKYKYNINGRICLSFCLFFMFAGLIIMYIFNPLLLHLFSLLNSTIFYIILHILFFVFIADLCISFKIINDVKKLSFNTKMDSTIEINRFVTNTIKNKSYLYKRLISSFPNFEPSILKIKDSLEKDILKFEEKLNSINEDNKKKSQKYKKKINKIKNKLYKLKKGN